MRNKRTKTISITVLLLVLVGSLSYLLFASLTQRRVFVIDGIGSVSPPKGWMISPRVRNSQEFNTQFNRDGVRLICKDRRSVTLGKGEDVEVLFLGAQKSAKKDITIGSQTIHAAVLGYDSFTASGTSTGTLGYSLLLYKPLPEGSNFIFLYGGDDSLEEVFTDSSRWDNVVDCVLQTVGFSFTE